MSRTWFNFLCCSIKKRMENKTEMFQAWGQGTGPFYRGYMALVVNAMGLCRWGFACGVWALHQARRTCDLARSSQRSWGLWILPCSKSHCSKEKSHMVLMAAFVAYQGWSLRSPGPCDGSMSVSGSSLSPLNHLWVPHMRRCPRWHVLTSTCWRWAEFMSLCQSLG